ncbi:hypothetical protein NL676_005596 [Syzygium grande]|nr:hypothetical protein NL676_005596 [Syzygium grande]
MPPDSNKTDWIVQVNENRTHMPSASNSPREKWSIWSRPHHRPQPRGPTSRLVVSLTPPTTGEGPPPPHGGTQEPHDPPLLHTVQEAPPKLPRVPRWKSQKIFQISRRLFL